MSAPQIRQIARSMTGHWGRLVHCQYSCCVSPRTGTAASPLIRSVVDPISRLRSMPSGRSRRPRRSRSRSARYQRQRQVADFDRQAAQETGTRSRQLAEKQMSRATRPHQRLLAESLIVADCRLFLGQRQLFRMTPSGGGHVVFLFFLLRFQVDGSQRQPCRNTSIFFFFFHLLFFRLVRIECLCLYGKEPQESRSKIGFLIVVRSSSSSSREVEHNFSLAPDTDHRFQNNRIPDGKKIRYGRCHPGRLNILLHHNNKGRQLGRGRKTTTIFLTIQLFLFSLPEGAGRDTRTRNVDTRIHSN